MDDHAARRNPQLNMCGDQPLLDSDDEMASEASAQKLCITDLE